MKNRFEVRGDITAIFLTGKNGQIIETIIDTADLSIVNSFPMTWYANWREDIQSYYVEGQN